MLVIFASVPIYGTQDITFGLGGETTGRASGVSAEPNSSFAALFNPALISAQKVPLLGFSVASTGARYNKLPRVRVDGPKYRTQTGATSEQDIAPSPPPRLLWAAGFSYPFTLPPILGGQGAGIGATLSGPFEQLRTFSAGSPYDFYSLRYGNSDDQFKATLGGSLEIIPEALYFGAGLSFYISAAGNADAIIAVDNPTGRFALDVSLNSAAIVGLYGQLEKFQASLIYRQPVDPTFEQRFQGSAQIAQGTNTITLPLIARASLYYEPQRIEADIQRTLGAFTASVGASFQQWANFRAPYLLLSAPDAQQNTAQTALPPLNLQNTLNPRVSGRWQATEALAVSAGYQFKPTPVPQETASGPLNLLDTNVHVVGISVGYRFAPSAWWPMPFTLSASGQYHFLTARAVKKNNPEFIGAPNYTVGGDAYIYGLSLDAEL